MLMEETTGKLMTFPWRHVRLPGGIWEGHTRLSWDVINFFCAVDQTVSV